MSVVKITMAHPSPLDGDYGKIYPRWVTYHQLQATFDEKGYVKTWGRLLKVVHRDFETNKVIAIMPY